MLIAKSLYQNAWEAFLIGHYYQAKNFFVESIKLQQNKVQSCIFLCWIDENELLLDKQPSIIIQEYKAIIKNAWGSINDSSFLGLCYEYGFGVEKNSQQAIIHYRAGVVKNCPLALGQLAVLLSESEEVNPQEIAGYYSRAAEKGYLYMQYMLASHIEAYPDIVFSYRPSIELIEQAAQAGEMNAQNELAKMYEEGIGRIPLSITQALKWYKACCQSSMGSFLYPEALKKVKRLAQIYCSG